MTFKTYPDFSSSSTAQQDLRRISQLRDDDRAIISSMQDKDTYLQAFYPNVREVSTNTSFGKFDYHIEVNAASGAITINLPDDETIACREVLVSKKDASANVVTVDGLSKNINGSGTASVATQYAFKRFHYMPAAGEWRIV